MNRTRKTSSGTYKKMEPTGPKVLSRYLRSPTGSCHDNCKSAIKETTETKAINPFPKRVPKSPADRTHVDAPISVNRIKKSPSVIPRVITRNLKNNNVVKDQIEPKKRDLKTENSRAKTSSRTPIRRHSDIFLPNKAMPLPSSRSPKRRLSEVIHPNRDLASVSNASLIRGSRIIKNESRKDLKIPLVNKRSSSLKTTVSTLKINAKVPPLRTYKSLPKLEVRGSRKPKPARPIEKVVPEKTLHVIEPKHDIEITKSQSQISPDSTHPRNGLEEYSPSMEHDNPAKDGQQDDQNGLQVSPSMEDDNPANDGQQDDQNGQVSSPSIEDDNPTKEDHQDDQNGMQVSSPSMEDDTTEKHGQLNDYVSISEVDDTEDTIRVGKLVVETSDGSPSDLRFRRGTILSPQSDNNSPRQLEFKKGTELDEETGEAEKVSLRRLSSDGEVCIPESHVISVDLKHQETKEKIDPGLFNNVIEETASKLIRARKSKVKALVGAFENIVSGSRTS